MAHVDINRQLGVIQFQNISLHLITTPISGLTLVRTDKDEFRAFYGSKGRSELTKETFEEIHKELGLAVPDYPTVADSDDDFVGPDDD